MNQNNPYPDGTHAQPRIDPDWAAMANEPPPPVGYQFQGAPPRPLMPPPTGSGWAPQRMGLAIAATVLCFPLGLYAVYLASQVPVKTSMGDVAGAFETSNKVKIVSMIAIGIGALFGLMILMAGCSALMTSAAYY
jgi:hypothetical protein